MDEMLEQIWNELIEQLRTEAAALGEELGEAVEDAAAYAAERTRHLANILASGEPGFGEAVTVERDNVALKAGLLAVDRADALDERFKSTMAGMMDALATALSIII